MSWLTEKQIAEKLERQPRTIRKKVIAGQLPISYRAVHGRRYQYSERDLEKYLKSVTINR